MRVDDHGGWGEMLWWLSERDADGHQHLNEGEHGMTVI
jgi:hypothetical protein